MNAEARISFRIAGLVLLLPVLAGCQRPEPIRREQLNRGYVMILPGVECYGALHVPMAAGLRDAGEDRAIEIEEWGSHPFGTFPNLMRYGVNRVRAECLARKLIDYRTAHPTAPITLIGFSGGGGMALFMAEALPAGLRLDRIILLGAAVSPEYDLGPAMAHCDRGIVNFYSERDWFMVGVCTNVFGTMDRKHTSAAGRIGFRDCDGRLSRREGLIQVGWVRGWRELGHGGHHSGWQSRDWAREILAPYVMGAPEIAVGAGAK